MDNKRKISLIKEMAREQNLRTMNFIVDMPPTPNEYLTEEEELSGGESSNLRGETSEAAMHYTIGNYLEKKQKLMSRKKNPLSEDEAHTQAIEHIHSPEHVETLRKQLSQYTNNKVIDRQNKEVGKLNASGNFETRTKNIKEKYGNLTYDDLKDEKHPDLKLELNKKIQDHMRDYPTDSEHTLRDSVHASSHWINHLVKKHGHLRSTTLTGPIGEVETAKRIGATNADLVVHVQKPGEKKQTAVEVPRGNSLKYTTEDSNTVKVRTPGEKAFHEAVAELATSAGMHHHASHLSQLYDSLESEREKISPQKKKPKDWDEKVQGKFIPNHEHIGNNAEFQHIANTIEKKGYDRPTTLGDAQSVLRKIHRKENGKANLGTSSANPKHWTYEHYNKLGEMESKLKQSRINYTQHVSNVLNNVYDEHDKAAGQRKTDLITSINRFHRDISGISHRRRKYVKISTPAGQEFRANAVPTVLMKIQRNKKTKGLSYEPPKVKLHGLYNMLEKTSSKADRFRANVTDGGGINISAERKQPNEKVKSTSIFRHSLDSGRGHMISMITNALSKLHGK